MQGVRRKTDSGVFKAISDGLKNFRMVDGKERKHASDQLTLMNIPPLLAKRDAAYDAAVEIIAEKRNSTSSGEMLVAYSDTLQLLNVSEKTNSEIEAAIVRLEHKRQAESIRAYLTLLSDVATSALFLLNSGSVICANTTDVTSFIGDTPEFAPKTMLGFFSDIETILRRKFLELASSAVGNLEKERSRNHKTLSKIDRDRYDEAFKLLKGNFRG
jgi:hypothetical protein